MGLFQNPQAVFVDPIFLETLSAREIRSGFAEIIKHSLIADAQLWQRINQINQLSEVDWAQWLPPSLRIKQRVVEKDPFEQNIRKTLNFGHTIGHAFEAGHWKVLNPYYMERQWLRE